MIKLSFVQKIPLGPWMVLTQIHTTVSLKIRKKTGLHILSFDIDQSKYKKVASTSNRAYAYFYTFSPFLREEFFLHTIESLFNMHMILKVLAIDFQLPLSRVKRRVLQI